MNQELIVTLLYQTLQVDGSISSQEIKFLEYVAHQIGITVEDLNRIVQSDVQISFPSMEQERIQILYYLLFAISSDREITDEEKVYVKKLSLRMGFRPSMVGNMIEVMEKYNGKRIPDDALVNEIKPYLN